MKPAVHELAHGALFSLVSLAALLLSACGSGTTASDSSNSTIAANSNASSSAPSVSSVFEAIQKGEANGTLPILNRDASIAGPDTDGNGVRDDIDAYIDRLTDTPAQKAALRQLSAGILASMIADVHDKNALDAASKAITNGTACLDVHYDSATATAKGAEIEKLTVNTKKRVLAYAAFSNAISGTTFTLPPIGEGCVN
jgi:hypothetical protein